MSTPLRSLLLCVTLFLLSSLPAFAQTEITWDIETSKTISVPREIRRGENLTLLPRFLSYSVVTQLATNASIQLWYRSADMSNGLYYVATGSVHSATGGIARIPWTASNCATATNYTYDIIVQTNSILSNLRGFGTIRLLDGVYSQATTATNPTTWRALDWATITNINTASSPFLTSAGNAITASTCTGIVVGIIATNNINGALITAGTITSNALDAATDAAYRSGSGGGTDGAVVTQIVSGIILTGSVAGASWSANAANATNLDGVSRVNLTNGFVTATITNGLAPITITNGLAPVSITNGLAPVSAVVTATQSMNGATIYGTVTNANNLIVAGGGASGPQLTGYLNADLEPFWEFQRTDNPFNEHMFFGWHTNFGTSTARAGIGWYSTTSLKRWGLYNYATDGTVGLSVGQATNYLYLFGKQGNVTTNGATNVVFSGILKLTNLVINGDINVASTNFNGTRGIAASFWYAGDTDSWIKVRSGLTTDYRAYLAWTPYDSDNYHWVMGRDMATNFVLYSPVADSHTIYSDPRGDTHFQAASNGWLKFNAMAGQGSTNGVVFYSGGSAPGEIAKIAASGAGRMASMNLTNDSYNAVNIISGGTVFERFCWFANQRVLVKDATAYAEFLAAGGAGIQIAPNYDESVNGGFFFTANNRLGIATNLPSERLDVNGSALIRTNLTVSGTITSSVLGCTAFNLDGTNAVRAAQNGASMPAGGLVVTGGVLSAGNAIYYSGGEVTGTITGYVAIAGGGPPSASYPASLQFSFDGGGGIIETGKQAAIWRPYAYSIRYGSILTCTTNIGIKFDLQTNGVSLLGSATLGLWDTATNETATTTNTWATTVIDSNVWLRCNILANTNATQACLALGVMQQ